MAATLLEKVGTGATKGWKSKCYSEETAGGTCCSSVGLLKAGLGHDWYKKSTLERQNSVPQTLNIPSSTEHNIIERFRESGDISVTFRPSGSSALEPDLILSWKSLPGHRNTSRNHCL